MTCFDYVIPEVRFSVELVELLENPKFRGDFINAINALSDGQWGKLICEDSSSFEKSQYFIEFIKGGHYQVVRKVYKLGSSVTNPHFYYTGIFDLNRFSYEIKYIDADIELSVSMARLFSKNPELLKVFSKGFDFAYLAEEKPLEVTRIGDDVVSIYRDGEARYLERLLFRWIHSNSALDGFSIKSAPFYLAEG